MVPRDEMSEGMKWFGNRVDRNPVLLVREDFQRSVANSDEISLD